MVHDFSSLVENSLVNNSRMQAVNERLLLDRNMDTLHDNFTVLRDTLRLTLAPTHFPDVDGILQDFVNGLCRPEVGASGSSSTHSVKPPGDDIRPDVL